MNQDTKMTKNILWVLLEKGGQQIAAFILFLIIARLLGPEEYGLAMISFVFLVLAQLIMAGIGESVVTLQLKHEKKDQLSTLFWTVIAVGSFVSVVLFLTADAFATLFEEERLSSLLRWLAIVPILLAIETVPHMMIMQEMNFHIYAIRSLVSTILSGAVGVYLAFNGYGAMALIIQQIVLYILANIIVWYFITWRPSMVFKKIVFRETLRPGFRMFFSNMLTFLEQQIPRLFLGFYQELASVGYFSFSFRMRFALQDILMTPLFMVLFPALSQIKNNENEHHKIISNMILVVGILIFPAITMAVLTAPYYVPLLLGDKWIDAIPFLQLFMALGYFIPFVKLAEVLSRVHNRVDLYLKGQYGLIGLGTLAIYFASFESLMAVGWVIAVITVLSIPVYFELLRRYANIQLWIYFKKLWKSILSNAAMAGAVWGFIQYIQIDNRIIMFLSILIFGGSVYCIMTALLQRHAILSAIKNYKAKSVSND